MRFFLHSALSNETKHILIFFCSSDCGRLGASEVMDEIGDVQSDVQGANDLLLIFFLIQQRRGGGSMC
jgi:hypothetical protein